MAFEWVDFRNSIETAVGINPNDSAGAVLANAVVGTVRDVGTVLAGPPASSPPKSGTAAAQQAVVQTATKMVAGMPIYLWVGAGLAVLLLLRRR